MTPCEEDLPLYLCQRDKCTACWDTDGALSPTCAYEKWLYMNSTKPLHPQCNDCYKTLIQQFPIDKTKKKFCATSDWDGLDCLGLAGFDQKSRVVKARRDRCLSPNGVPKQEPRLSGNFVDCRYQGRQTFEYIDTCAHDNGVECPGNTTVTF